MMLKREFFFDNLLVRIHFIIEMIGWTGLAPWEFEFPFPGSLTSTFVYLFHTRPCMGRCLGGELRCIEELRCHVTAPEERVE